MGSLKLLLVVRWVRVREAVLVAGLGCVSRDEKAKLLLRSVPNHRVVTSYPGTPGYRSYLRDYGEDTPYLLIDGERVDTPVRDTTTSSDGGGSVDNRGC